MRTRAGTWERFTRRAWRGSGKAIMFATGPLWITFERGRLPIGLKCIDPSAHVWVIRGRQR